jgi:hypothetical protein
MKTIFNAILVIAVFFSLASTTGCAPNENNNAPKTDTTQTDRGSIDPLTAFRVSFAKLPLGEQKSVFSAMSPELKAELWKNRLGEAAKTASDDEKTLLSAAMNEIKPAAYTTEGKKQFESFLKEWKTNAQKVFSDPVRFTQLTTRLDDDGGETIAIRPVRTSCTCSTVDDHCPTDSPCATGNCFPSMDGCGCFWMYACDGLCSE